MTRILFVSTDVVGPEMAGPGIRAWELARVLAREHAVTLAAPGGALQPPGFRLAPYRLGEHGALAPLLEDADVVVGQGFAFQFHPELLRHDRPLAIDLYDPLILESLDLYAAAAPDEVLERHAAYQALTEAQLRRGDFFFCATERQRDYWLGALTALGRLNPPLARSMDRDLRRFVDLVPSGIAPGLPAAEGALRGRHPAIPRDAIVLLWAGGLWDWFDPLVIVRAVARLRAEFPALRLVFQAGARPNPYGEPFRPANYGRVRALAEELGVLDRAVVLLEEWVPYERRGAYLAEADVGVSAHLPGIETRFAFRTRLLDYLWARLPVVCTAGDTLGEAFAAVGAALLVAPGDEDGWVAALRRLAGDATARAAFRAAAEPLAHSYAWEEVARPLVAFCAAPGRAAPPLAAPSETEGRIAELEAAMEERLAYTRHVERQYALALEQARRAGLRGRLRAWLGRVGRG